MPTFTFRCDDCGATRRFLADEPPDHVECVCENESTMRRVPRGPSATVKERLDNGLQRRVVERFADAERLYEERRLAADPRAGGRAGLGRHQAE